MAWTVELSRAAERVLRDATKTTGWVDDLNYPEEVAELERAGLVYDGAVTCEGDLRDKQS
jgi:hypothetical protein